MLHQCFVAGILGSVLLVFYAFAQFTFLKPYLWVIWHDYLAAILVVLAMVTGNVTALLYVTLKGFSMKTTGRKLEHLDKGLAGESSVLADLSERLQRQ